MKNLIFSSIGPENDVIQGALLKKGATRRAVLEGNYSRYPSSHKSHTYYISSHLQNTLDVFFINNADTPLLNRGCRQEIFSATYVYEPSEL